MSTATAEHFPTLAEIEASHAETGKLIAAFKARATTQVVLAALQIDLKHGERYAGAILNDDGTVGHHLILLPGQADDINWKDAQDWAAKAGGELPTRREQALLFANLKGGFETAYYWSSEQYSDSSAWYQYFNSGTQGFISKSAELRARAVRRLSA